MRNFFILILFFISGQVLFAQYDAQISNFWAGNSYFNPAYAGHSVNLEATALYRQQWLGVENAPRTVLLSVELPYKFLDRIHGLGAIMFSEKIGLFERTIISGQYAYKKDLWKGTLSIGLQGGYIKESFAGTKVNPEEMKDDYHQETDPSIPTTTDVAGSSVDASLGVFYSKKNWYAGVSVTHLTAPQLLLGENYVLDIPRSYYLTGGYNIQLNNPLLELRSAFLVKSMEFGTIESMMKTSAIDLSLRMVYNKMFWGGLGWRQGDAMVVMLGGNFKMIQAGYAYDFPISSMLKGSTGSHEIFIKYIVDLNLGKGKKNKHKSVRLL